MEDSERLSLKTKLLLALGQSVEGIWVTVGGYYLNKFFLETCCIQPALVGLIQLGVGLFDAFNDTLIGALSDKTRTRWGRRRPWLLFGGPFLAIAYLAVWYRLPLDTPQEWKMLYYTTAFMSVSVGLTSVRVQITALLPELTRDYNERMNASGFTVVGVNVIGLAFAMIHAFIVGTAHHPSSFMQSAAVCSAAILIFSWTVFCGIKAVKDSKCSVGSTSFCYVTLMYLAGPTAVTLTQTNIALFCKYALMDESILMLLVPIVQGTALLMIPVWVFIANKTSKRHIYLIGGSLLAMSMAALNFVNSTEAAILLGILIGMPLAVPYLVPISMLPDVVEEDEERTGRRREGVLSGLFTTALKLSVTAGSVLTNLALEQGVFETAEAAQAASVVQVMRWLVGPIPACFVLLAMFAAWRFPITPTSHAERLERQAKAQSAEKVGESENPKAEKQVYSNWEHASTKVVL